ncbi:MAG: prolipoprotein diacylglyceryl transferase [Planctomycetota bacterium]|nr:MAG: prolipoprotein diacylglyceryl transferase [Planctomycetota bacterium]
MHPELFTIPGINFTVPSYGAMVLIAFLGATFWMAHRAKKVKADPDIVLNLGFIILIFSAIGARAFYVLHRWDTDFAHNPAQIFNIRAGGFELYGGVLGAFIPCFLYLWYKGLSKRLYADLVAPSLLFGMGVGRIGCFLFGCCWGGSCPESVPWAVKFPFGSPPHNRQWQERQVTVPAELIFIDSSGIAAPMPKQILIPDGLDKIKQKLDRKSAALAEAEKQGDQKKIERARTDYERWEQMAQPLFNHFKSFDTTTTALADLADGPEYYATAVHPSQIYGAIGPLLLAWLTSAYFYRRKRHGTVFLLAMTLYAVERFMEEAIRIDNLRDTLGMTASQAISIALFVISVMGFFILQKLQLRSPRAVPCQAAGQKTDSSSSSESANEVP